MSEFVISIENNAGEVLINGDPFPYWIHKQGPLAEEIDGSPEVHILWLPLLAEGAAPSGGHRPAADLGDTEYLAYARLFNDVGRADLGAPVLLSARRQIADHLWTLGYRATTGPRSEGSA